MMKKNFLILLLLSIGVNAQVNRFYYEYKYIPDANNTADVKKDLMVLDIDKKNGSHYYKDKSHKLLDSLSKKFSEYESDEIKQLRENPNNKIEKKQEHKIFTIGKNNDYQVIKQYPEYKTYLIKNLSTDKYKILEDQKPVWQISQDKQKIGEYTAQKASTNFGGREWTAWFTLDIPFQDGPYKFCGLPGLIVKIEDATASHCMTLVGNKVIVEGNDKKKIDDDLPKNLASVIKGNEIEITKEKFEKLSQEYKQDPSRGLRLLLSSLGSNARISTKVVNKDSNGKLEETSMNDVYRLIDKTVKENDKSDNNPIELDVVQ